MWQVFRTYNASITLDRLLQIPSAKVHNAGTLVDKKKAAYETANKEVPSGALILLLRSCA